MGGRGEDYRLLVEKKGKQPESIELKLEYAKAITQMPGQNSVTFQAPQAPVSRWRVAIPQAGVKVNLSPLIAATEVPPADDQEGDDTAKPAAGRGDRGAGLRGAAPDGAHRLDRQGRRGHRAGCPGQRRWPSSKSSISEGMTRLRVKLAYTISRAELGQLAIEVPADYKVVNVFDPNVRQWSVEARRQAAAGTQAVQKITVQLFEPAKNVAASDRGTGEARDGRRKLRKAAGKKRRKRRRAGRQGPGRGPPAGRRGGAGGRRTAGRGHAHHRPAASRSERIAPAAWPHGTGPLPIAMRPCPTSWN